MQSINLHNWLKADHLTYLHTKNDKQIKGSEKIDFCALVKKLSEALNVLFSLYLICKWIRAPFVSNSSSRNDKCSLGRGKPPKRGRMGLLQLWRYFYGVLLAKDVGCFLEQCWKVACMPFSCLERECEHFSVFWGSFLQGSSLHTLFFEPCRFWMKTFSYRAIETKFCPTGQNCNLFLQVLLKTITTYHFWSIFLAL